MKINKRVLSLIMFLIVIILTIPAFATEELDSISFDQKDYYKLRKELYSNSQSKPMKLTFKSPPSVEKYLIQEALNYNSSIDVTSYNILVSDIKTVFLKVVEEPQMFFIDPTKIRFYKTTDADTGLEYVTKILFVYTMDETEIQAANAVIDGVVNDYLAGIKTEWNDLEKIVYTKDYLCRNCSYATNIITSSHTLYGALVDKLPVCDGYAKAFNYLISKVGISTLFVTSDEMEHAWSMVNLDGTYYHVDITWDDDDDGMGRTQYKFFLVSDAGMQDSTRQHHDWVVPGNQVASDTKYDKAFWGTVKNYLVYNNNLWHYLSATTQTKELTFYKSNLRTSGFDIKSTPITTDFILYAAGMTSDGKYLYYTTQNFIYRIDFNIENPTRIYTLPSSPLRVLYSIEYMDGKYYYDAIDVIDGKTSYATRTTYELEYRPITKITLDKSNVELELGVEESCALNASITPTNTTEDTTIVWSSSDESVATVDQTGKVTAVKEGNVVISATASNKMVAQCNVEVIPKLIYTTLKEEVIDDALVLSFSDKVLLSDTINAEQFPILDRGYTINVTDMNGNKKTDAQYIGSYNEISILNKNNEVIRKYTVIVNGDITGDGKVKLYDAFQILKGTLYSKNLSVIDKLIRDYNLDGRVAIYDAFRFIRKAILS